MKPLLPRLLLLSAALAVGFMVSPPSVHAVPVSTPIESCADLQAIGDDATGTFVLTNDVDCSGISDFTSLANFQGTLDGDGYAISDLTVLASNYAGMFSTTNGATVRDLSLINSLVVGNFVVGTLAAEMTSTTVSNVYVQGSLYSTAALSLAGGVAGTISSSTFTHVRADVFVDGFSYVGGMVGRLMSTSTIESSFSQGNVSVTGNAGNAYAGGLVGQNVDSRLVNTYSQGRVSGGTLRAVGGLVGSHEGYGGLIENSYARGIVSNVHADTGGLVGLLVGDASSTLSYWDTETSLQATSATGTAKTTSQMQTLATFTGWDTSTVWFAPSAGVYPLLRAFDITAPTVPGTPSAENPTRYTPYVSWTAATDAGVGLAAQAYTVQWSTTAGFGGTVYTSTTSETTFRDLTTLADGTWYYRVSAKDKLGQASGYATSAAMIVDATGPVITRLGDATVSINQYTSYADAGATALDAVQGTLTSGIVVTNPVDTAVAGTYTVSYIVTDAAGNVAEPVLRTVNVVFVQRGGGSVSASVQPAAIQSAGGSVAPLVMTANGSVAPVVKTALPTVRLGFNADPAKVKGYAASLRADFMDASIYPYQAELEYALPAQAGTHTVHVKLYSVSGHASPVLARTVEYAPEKPVAATSVQMTAAPMAGTYQFARNLRVGMQGEDVRQLQKFLNARGFVVAARGNGSVGRESVYFGPATARALARFQETHQAQVLAPLSLTKGTGNFLGATRAFVNAGAM